MEDDEEPSKIEEDPIIQEYPLYLSKRLEDQLYVFQYPLKPDSNVNNMQITKCLMKPKSQEALLEVKLDITSENFDMSRAEMIAQNIDGPSHKKDKEVMFENEMMDRITLTSCNKVVKDVGTYAVGVFDGKEFHITPLKGLLQMRPSFTHLDKTAKRKRDVQVESDDEGEVSDSAAKAEQVMVKIARGEIKDVKEKRVQDEPWVDCTWNDIDSGMSRIERLKLYAENKESVHFENKLCAVEYLRKLVPEDREEATIKPSLPSNVVSLHALRTLPILDQCRLLLKDAKIIPFQQLMMLLAGSEGVTPEVLLSTLPQVAVLVRGNWVVKSEVLYPQDTLSAVSGVKAEAMCRARDYVLYLFTKNQYVERRKVSSVIKIPSEEIKEIFTGISRLRYNKGWELKMPQDVDFINRYPEICSVQTAAFETKFKQFVDLFLEGKDKRTRRKSKSVSEDVKVSSRRERPSSSRDGTLSSDTDSGTERNRQSPIAARKSKGKLGNQLINSKDDVS